MAECPSPPLPAASMRHPMFDLIYCCPTNLLEFIAYDGRICVNAESSKAGKLNPNKRHPQTSDSRSYCELVGVPPAPEALAEELMFADELS